MEPATVSLLCASIGFAGQILSALIAGNSSSGSSCRLNRSFLGNVIQEGTTNLSQLLRTTETSIFERIRLQHVRDAVQGVQANVASLRHLLNLKDIDPNLASQLVVTALNPLQVSLETARLRLEDHQETDAFRICYIAGSSALVAGYAYLGYDAPLLREQLGAAMRDVQRRILDSVALTILAEGKEFPWESVPRLLTPAGAPELLELYRASAEVAPSRRGFNYRGAQVTAVLKDAALMGQALGERFKRNRERRPR